MADHYIIVNGAGVATGHISGNQIPPAPLTQANGIKIWYRAATMTKPTLDAWQELSAPVYNVANGTIIYTAVNRAISKLKEDAHADIDADRDARLASGKLISGNTYDARLSTMGALALKRERVARNGGQTTKNVTGVNTATGVVTVEGGALLDGIEVLFENVGGTTQLNGNTYIVSDRSGDTFKIKNRDGSYVSMSGFGSYTSGGTAKIVLTAITVDNQLVVMDFNSFTTMIDALSAWHNAIYEQARVYKNSVSGLSGAQQIQQFSHNLWPT